MTWRPEGIGDSEARGAPAQQLVTRSPGPGVSRPAERTMAGYGPASLDLILGGPPPSDALLALCMGSHCRLGSSSPLACLEPEILRLVVDLYSDLYKSWSNDNPSLPGCVRRRWNKEVQDWLKDPLSHAHFRAGPVTCVDSKLEWEANPPLMKLQICTRAARQWSQSMPTIIAPY
jgi:hypothetical protein